MQNPSPIPLCTRLESLMELNSTISHAPLSTLKGLSLAQRNAIGVCLCLGTDTRGQILEHHELSYSLQLLKVFSLLVWAPRANEWIPGQ